MTRSAAGGREGGVPGAGARIRGRVRGDRGAHCLVVCTEWPEFRSLDLGRIRDAMAYPFVVDARNLYEPGRDGRGRIHALPEASGRPGALRVPSASGPGHRRSRLPRIAPVRTALARGLGRRLRRLVPDRRCGNLAGYRDRSCVPVRSRDVTEELPDDRTCRRRPAPGLGRLPGDVPEAPDRDAPGRSTRNRTGPRAGRAARERSSCWRPPPRSTEIPRSIRNRSPTRGNVSPIGPRSVYDEAKRYAEALAMAYHRARGVLVTDRSHLQHLRPSDEDGRRPSRTRVHPAGSSGRAHHGPRRRQPDAIALLRGRSHRGALAAPSAPTIGAMNLGNPHEVTMLELAERDQDPHRVPPRSSSSTAPEDDPERRCPDITLAGSRPGVEAGGDARRGALEDGRMGETGVDERLNAESAVSELAPLIGDRVVILHRPSSPETGELSGSDIDCAVRSIHAQWPLRARGWRLVQCLHYDLCGWFWVLERAGDVIAFDTIDDPFGLGRDGIRPASSWGRKMGSRPRPFEPPTSRSNGRGNGAAARRSGRASEGRRTRTKARSTWR